MRRIVPKIPDTKLDIWLLRLVAFGGHPFFVMFNYPRHLEVNQKYKTR
jgi:hypothetical protein